MHNPFKRQKQEETVRLAESMAKLAEALNRVSDPQVWRDMAEVAATRLAGVLPMPLQPPMVTALGGEIITQPDTLSTEERARLATQVQEALSPQLEDFRVFVRAAVAELPTRKLLRAVQLIEQGAKPQLARRSGCIFLTLEGETPEGSDSFYLKL